MAKEKKSNHKSSELLRASRKAADISSKRK